MSLLLLFDGVGDVAQGVAGLVEARRPPAAGLFACLGRGQIHVDGELGDGFQGPYEVGGLVVGLVPVAFEPVVFVDAGEPLGDAYEVVGRLVELLRERAPLRLRRRGDRVLEAGAVRLDPAVACEEIDVGRWVQPLLVLVKRSLITVAGSPPSGWIQTSP